MGTSAAPVLRAHRYRLSAAIRPLLFWIGARNVGGAQIVWRQGDGARLGYELLLGSDPQRAPRRINRWGWVREDRDETGADMLGLMNRSEDDSLDQAKARLASDGKDGYFFKAIRTRIADGGARAESTHLYAPHDYTFREIEPLWEYVQKAQVPPRVRTGKLPDGTRPGLLFALADLVREAIERTRTPEAARAARGRTVQYTFNAAVYDLTLKSTKRVRSASFGGRGYEDLVQMDIESFNRERKTGERLTIVCATSGTLTEVPVYVRYQPKWWFKIEAVLDETEPL